MAMRLAGGAIADRPSRPADPRRADDGLDPEQRASLRGVQSGLGGIVIISVPRGAVRVGSRPGCPPQPRERAPGAAADHSRPGRGGWAARDPDDDRRLHRERGEPCSLHVVLTYAARAVPWLRIALATALVTVNDNVHRAWSQPVRSATAACTISAKARYGSSCCWSVREVAELHGKRVLPAAAAGVLRGRPPAAVGRPVVTHAHRSHAHRSHAHRPPRSPAARSPVARRSRPWNSLTGRVRRCAWRRSRRGGWVLVAPFEQEQGRVVAGGAASFGHECVGQSRDGGLWGAAFCLRALELLDQAGVPNNSPPLRCASMMPSVKNSTGRRRR